MIRFDCISDTHGLVKLSSLAWTDAPIMIHAGDLTRRGSIEQTQQLAKELGKLPHQYKLVIGGNHDHALAKDDCHKLFEDNGVIYLQNELVIIDGVTLKPAWTRATPEPRLRSREAERVSFALRRPALPAIMAIITASPYESYQTTYLSITTPAQAISP